MAALAGIVLASLLFIRRMAELSGATLLTGDQNRHLHREIPDRVAFYEIRGPLFFGAADKAIGVIQQFNREVLVVVRHDRNRGPGDAAGPSEPGRAGGGDLNMAAKLAEELRDSSQPAAALPNP